MKNFWNKLNTYERWSVGLASSFVLAVTVAGVVFRDGVMYYLVGPSFANSARACRDPRNSKLPYCLESKFKKDAEWRDLNSYQNGKTNPFTLYRK